MKRIATILLLICAVSACTPLQLAMEEIQVINTRCKDQAKAPAFDSLRGKIVNLTEPATMQMLADSSTLDDAQRAALVELDKVLLQCSSESVAALRKQNLHAYADLSAGIGERGTALRADLYRGALTIGEYNRRFAELKDRFLADLNSMQQRQAQTAAAQAASTAATIQAINALNPPRPVYTPPPMRTTTCTPFGNQVRCTTF